MRRALRPHHYSRSFATTCSMSSPRPFSYARALTGKPPNPSFKPSAPSSAPSPPHPDSTQDSAAATLRAPPPQRSSRDAQTGTQSPSRPTTYIQDPSHIPNTSRPESLVYVLTLQTTPSLQSPLNALRERHFPRHLNRTPAHLTLFHALPHSRLDAITSSLDRLSRTTNPYAVSTGKPFRLRMGVAVHVARGYEQVKATHARLRDEWTGFLSEQDRGGWRGHWTVMNKAADEESVRRAWEDVTRGFGGAEGMAEGLTLWRYERGFWIFEREFRFDAGGQ